MRVFMEYDGNTVLLSDILFYVYGPFRPGIRGKYVGNVG